MSKSATVDYLTSYFDEDIELHRIYRYLDKLHNTQQEKIQQISVAHTTKILGGRIGLVFYDITTLYSYLKYGKPIDYIETDGGHIHINRDHRRFAFEFFRNISKN